MVLHYLVGITGGIGSGKTFICNILEKMGYPVFYSDTVSKNLLVSDNEIVSEIKNLLGRESYYSDGTANKKFIADQIFNDETKLSRMNKIMHPAVRKAFKKFSENQNSPLIFNEAAILFETDAYKQFDKTILITAPKTVKIKRVQKRDNLSKELVEARMSKQWEDAQKIPLADYVINNGESDMILPQINKVIADIIE